MKLSLSTRLSGDFDEGVRSRGQAYFYRGRVYIRHGSGDEVEARVKGSRNYDVSLYWEDGQLSADCECEYFDSVGPCKHLWATILAADAQGYLSAAAASVLVLDCGVLHPDGEPDYGEYEYGRGNRFPYRLVGEVPKPPPAPKLPDWQRQITEISQHGAETGRPSDAWPAKRQILYIVDVPNSVSAGCLVLSLASCTPKADGSWSRHGALSLKRRQVAQLPLAEDREILAALAGVKQYYGPWGYVDSYETLPASSQVVHPLSAMVMPLAVRTGRCYLQSGKTPDGLTPLAWDQGTARFFTALEALDKRLASGHPLRAPAEKLFQGPIADALTHVGQIAMLRRLAGSPLRGENYFQAEIVAGRVGREQAPAKVEF